MATHHRTYTLAERLRMSFERRGTRKSLLLIEWATICYTLLTLLFTLAAWGSLQAPLVLVGERLLVLLGVAAFYKLNCRVPSEFFRFLRNFYSLLLLVFWYPDIHNFCQVFPNLDHVFAEMDQVLFDGQPSRLFAATYSGKWWSELFHFGYFFYYPMILLGVLLPLLQSRRLFERTAFIVLASFFAFYAVYLFLPVAGPQFYFPLLSQADIAQGFFKPVGNYFATHAHAAPAVVGEPGLFRQLVLAMQGAGEHPIAAFPSSHVGMGLVLLIRMLKYQRVIGLLCVPCFVVLCFSTVYIEAHYAVDVFAGLFCGILFYITSRAFYAKYHR